MNSETCLKDFSRIGRRLFRENLVDGNFGNMSVVTSEGYFITHTGSYLDADPAEVVLMPRNGRMTPGASSEWRVHTAVYNATEHQAIVHAHPPHAVALSLMTNTIKTVESEGQLLAPEIAVVEGFCGTQDLADAVADGLTKSKIVIARGHGTFAAGKNLDEAYLYTSLAEHCCKVLYLTQLLKK
ncbi:MAG TPA: aldolase [Methanocorpusculum sp.]|nr:aldolase [Methanocorpusculum sp.]